MREYNLSKEERAEISTKMTELLELCQIHHCPMFATVALSNSLTKTEYENVTFGANANQVSLADDQIFFTTFTRTRFPTFSPPWDNVSILLTSRRTEA